MEKEVMKEKGNGIQKNHKNLLTQIKYSNKFTTYKNLSRSNKKNARKDT